MQHARPVAVSCHTQREEPGGEQNLLVFSPLSPWVMWCLFFLLEDAPWGTPRCPPKQDGARLCPASRLGSWQPLSSLLGTRVGFFFFG